MFLRISIFIFLFLIQNKLFLYDNFINFFFPNFILLKLNNKIYKKTETTHIGPLSIDIGDENNISFGNITYSGNFNIITKDKNITFLTLGSGNIILKILERGIIQIVGNSIFSGNLSLTGNQLITGNTKIEGTITSSGIITGNNGATINGITNINNNGKYATTIGNLSGDSINILSAGNITLKGKGISPTGGPLVLRITNGIVNSVSSSKKFKTEIKDLSINENDFDKLKPKKFKYNEISNTPNIYDWGLIAEDLIGGDFEFAVIFDENNKPISIDYQKIFIALLNEFLILKKNFNNLKKSLSIN
jgi:hypothetical protein